MWKIIALNLLINSFPCSLAVGAPAPIVIHEDFLYDSVTKERFTCRGVTVSPVSIEKPQTNMVDHFIDSHEEEWKPIIKSLKELNVNCIRLYQVCNVNDPEIIHPNKTDALPAPECGSHGMFMNALADAGIYAVVPVISGKPFESNTLKAEIGAPQCYDGKRGRNLFRTAAARVSEFAQYDNTLAFNVGNELVLHGNDDAMPAETGIFAFPCAKALARDLKRYMKKNEKLRTVPTLYAMQDSAGGPESITPQVRYLACSQNEDPDETVDILGFNTYSWCHKSDTYAKVYERYVSELPKKLNVPVLLTEFGCTGDKKDAGDPNMFTSQYPWTKNYRTWEQVPHIYNSTEMGARFSGAFAYELIMYAELRRWQQQGERISESYGLIATKVAGNVDKGEPNFKQLPTFYELSKRYKEVKEKVHYPKGEWTVPGRSTAMSCGEALNTTEMETWLQNYFLVDRTTKEKSKWWSEKAARYLATGSMPPTQYKSHMTTIVAVILGIVAALVTVVFVSRRYMKSSDSRAEFLTYDKLVEIGDEPLKKQESDEDTMPTTYGSMGSLIDITV